MKFWRPVGYMFRVNHDMKNIDRKMLKHAEIAGKAGKLAIFKNLEKFSWKNYQ